MCDYGRRQSFSSSSSTKHTGYCSPIQVQVAWMRADQRVASVHPLETLRHPPAPANGITLRGPCHGTAVADQTAPVGFTPGWESWRFFWGAISSLNMSRCRLRDRHAILQQGSLRELRVRKQWRLQQEGAPQM